MESYFNNKGIFKLLIKWKYHILTLIILSIISSVIFSSAYFIKPKFKSEAIVYPVNLGEYSEESHSEQMQQIFMSQEVTDKTIKKLNLGNHYNLDTTYEFYLSTLYFEFGKNVKIRKTEFESIQISALDIDPKIACEIVNTIIFFYNEKATEMHRSKYEEVVKIKTNELAKKQEEIDKLQKELIESGVKFNAIDYGNSLENLTDGNGKIKINSNEEYVSPSLNEIKYITEYIIYAKLKKELDEAIEGAEKEIAYYQLVSAPYPADKKTFPVRWVIVLLSVLGTFFMTLIIISIIESLKKTNSN